MLLSALSRAGFTLVLASLLFAGACRSHTDRIRVLEAEKAAAERENQKRKEDLANARAQLLEAQNRADKAEANAQAASAQADVVKRGRTGGTGDGGFDMDGMRRLAGDGVDVRETPDGALITLASDITFRPGRADLNTDAQAKLKQVASQIARENKIRAIRIEGHTDSDPIKKSNWRDNEELSYERAKVVRRFLVGNGVGEEMLTIEGYGARKPVASNEDKAGKARNRRVEIVLVSR
jgi:flagellar motor protein MotB